MSGQTDWALNKHTLKLSHGKTEFNDRDDISHWWSDAVGGDGEGDLGVDGSKSEAKGWLEDRSESQSLVTQLSTHGSGTQVRGVEAVDKTGTESPCSNDGGGEAGVDEAEGLRSGIVVESSRSSGRQGMVGIGRELGGGSGMDFSDLLGNEIVIDGEEVEEEATGEDIIGIVGEDRVGVSHTMAIFFCFLFPALCVRLRGSW